MKIALPQRDSFSFFFYAMAMVCLCVFLFLLLGKLLVNFQPWLSIVFISYSVLVHWKQWNTLIKYFKDREQYRSQISYQIFQCILALCISIMAILVLFLKGQYSYWLVFAFLGLATLLMPLSLILSLGGINKTRKSLKKSLLGRHEPVSEEEVIETRVGLLGWWPRIIGNAIVGVVSISIFLPLVFFTANSRNLNVLDILLFVDIPKISFNASFLQNIAHLWSTENLPFLFAYGVLYGAISIVFGFFVLSVQKRGWVESIITFNGLLFGYFLTVLVVYILGITPSLVDISQLNLAYVFLITYLVRFITDRTPRKGWGTQAKYNQLVDGVSSVAIAGILSRIFHEWSVIFSGIIFYCCVFISTAVLDLIITKGFKLVIGGDINRLSKFRTERLSDCIRESPRRFWFSTAFNVILGIIFPCLAFGLIHILN